MAGSGGPMRLSAGRRARSASVVVRSGPAEVTIIPSPRYLLRAVEARDRFGKPRNDPGTVSRHCSGSRPSGDPSRADQVAKQYRQMPPLSA